MPLQTAPSLDALHERLREDVLDLHFLPGATVTEAAVALRYRVARPTAKLAIERLVGVGLLQRETNRAARVPIMSAEDVSDLYGARKVVEAAAVERLARHGSIPAAALIAHRQLVALGQGASGFARLDADFHRALIAGQDSPRLARLHGLLMGEVELCLAQVQAQGLLTSTEIAEQHQGILDAVIAGDADLAALRTAAHIDGARDRLVAACRRAESTHEDDQTFSPAKVTERAAKRAGLADTDTDTSARASGVTTATRTAYSPTTSHKGT